MKKLFSILLTCFILSMSLFVLSACEEGNENNGGENPPTHTHIYNKKVISDKYKKTDATCETDAVYFYSCDCGEKGEDTFIDNYSRLNHNYGEWVSNGDTTHTKICTNDTSHKETNNCDYDNDYICTICKHELQVSKGLSFSLINNDTEYEVSGMGDCTDIDIIIPPIYNNKPVTRIGDGAFYDSAPLKSIEIPDSITRIGKNAFGSWLSLESSCYSLQYNEKDGLKYLGNNNNKYLYLADRAENITTATIDNNCKIIGFQAFRWCDSLKSIIIPDSVISIENSAFDSCSSLESVSFGEKSKLEIIGVWAFRRCDSLKSIIIPDSVISIENLAFDSCSSLESVTIGSGVTSIGGSVFNECSSLESVTIGSSVTSIGDDAFSSCFSLENINVDDENTTYKSVNGNLYSKDGKTFIQYAKGKTATSFSVPDSVTSIGDGAFSACNSLKSVSFGGNTKLESIGERAFSYCYSLESIIIPDSVMNIGFWAFRRCDSLTNIYCEAESKPSGWDNEWNISCPATVRWGYKG